VPNQRPPKRSIPEFLPAPSDNASYLISHSINKPGISDTVIHTTETTTAEAEITPSLRKASFKPSDLLMITVGFTNFIRNYAGNNEHRE